MGKDPIGFDGDGPNLYGYALNDPVNNFDNFGLMTCSSEIYYDPQCIKEVEDRYSECLDEKSKLCVSTLGEGGAVPIAYAVMGCYNPYAHDVWGKECSVKREEERLKCRRCRKGSGAAPRHTVPPIQLPPYDPINNPDTGEPWKFCPKNYRYQHRRSF